MELSRIKLTPAYEGAGNLYYEGGELTEGAIYIKAGESVNFCTFFSALDAQLLLERTSVKKVTLNLFYDGEAEVEINRYLPAASSPKNGALRHTNYIIAKYVSADGFSADVDMAGGGIVGFRVHAKKDVYFYGGAWECDDRYIQREVRLSVIMCTYKREKEVLDNAAKLSELCIELPDISAHIVDNGNTLKLIDMPPRVNLISNKNLGGSGGFSRGMIEAIKRDDTHFLLMDDDIVLEPDSVRRVYNLLSLLRAEASESGIGGAMMTFDNPCIVYENGAKCGAVKIKHVKENITVDNAGGLLWCRADCNADYAGWWFYAGTVDMLLKKGLSLPLFVKTDDVEFGIRNKKDHPTIFTIGVGVWHKSFGKETPPPIEYYANRNFLIIKGVQKKSTAAFWRANLALLKFLGNKDTFAYVEKAIDDYLKGPEYLMTLDQEQLNDKLWSQMPKRRSFIGRFFTCIGTFLKMLFVGRGVAKRYNKKREELASVKNWCDRLELTAEDGEYITPLSKK